MRIYRSQDFKPERCEFRPTDPDVESAREVLRIARPCHGIRLHASKAVEVPVGAGAGPWDQVFELLAVPWSGEGAPAAADFIAAAWLGDAASANGDWGAGLRQVFTLPGPFQMLSIFARSGVKAASPAGQIARLRLVAEALGAPPSAFVHPLAEVPPLHPGTDADSGYMPSAVRQRFAFPVLHNPAACMSDIVDVAIGWVRMAPRRVPRSVLLQAHEGNPVRISVRLFDAPDGVSLEAGESVRLDVGCMSDLEITAAGEGCGLRWMVL